MTCPICGRRSPCRNLAYVGRRGPAFVAKEVQPRITTTALPEWAFAGQPGNNNGAGTN